ncbi:MAG TPA: hypothetical protein VFU37_02115 [Pyrinomonadaceae bacterium]|nr:hypothetical protein [Pyrinomonadaceae bacterium]
MRRSAGGLGVPQLIVPGELAAHVRDAVSAVDANVSRSGSRLTLFRSVISPANIAVLQELSVD